MLNLLKSCFVVKKLDFVHYIKLQMIVLGFNLIFTNKYIFYENSIIICVMRCG